MKDKINKFLRVFQIELEDLEEDLRVLCEMYAERQQKGEITHYVLLENSALIMNEIAGVESILQSLSSMCATSYSSLEEMVDDIDEKFRDKTMHSGFPEAVYALVRRKLEKVLKYVQDSES